MNTQDALWKAIIEEFFDDFLQHFFGEYYNQMDTKFPYVFLDKELSKIYPETTSINRRGDKLIKIRLKNGQEQFILLHTEVQGYKDPNFARRMYVCQYRIDERYNLPVTALVIYTDANKENRVNQYEQNCLGTNILYQFNTYSIADYSVAEYEKMDNPFAIVCQVALLGLQKKLKDEEFFQQKITLFRKMLSKNYSKERIVLMTNFIKDYVRFSNKDFYRKFDEQADILTKNIASMGLYETMILTRKQEGRFEEARDLEIILLAKKEVEKLNKERLKQGLEELDKDLRELLEEGLIEGMKEREKGLRLERRLSEVEKTLEPVFKGIKGGMSIAQVSVILDVDKKFVREIVENKVDTQKLNTQLKKLRKQFKTRYTVRNLQTDLVKILSLHQFSPETISTVLKLKMALVQKIQEEFKTK